MLKTVYIDEVKDRLLLFDTNEYKMLWTTEESQKTDIPSLLEIKQLQQLYDQKGTSFKIDVPNDIRILKVAPNAKLSKKNVSTKLSHIYLGAKQIGRISTDLSNKDVDSLNKNGGVLVIYMEDVESIVFFTPYLKTFEKNNMSNSMGKSIVHDQQKNISTLISKNTNYEKQDEYINAIIKIPKEVSSSSKEQYQRLQDSVDVNLKMVQNLDYEIKYKMNHISQQLNQLLSEKKNNENIEEKLRILELELDKSYKTINNLHNDKNLLAEEKDHAEQIALNKLKSKLNLSKVAIQRQVDLNDGVNARLLITELVTKVLLKCNKDNNEINIILDDKDISSELTELSDNFATKIQSLLDIKSNLEELNIIDKKVGE
ncbi:hypothetical protein HUB98_09925 [Paenibacillus barcinonensis]|uniref:Uncharacterized protein n=1 Tax=Paenibacillus barcinonensis TaxID=198119 RepID=A0A2V4VSE9_PAEBA|nr:hypothetical protein [Paenibacillus barcinonensis]PYE49670.1 hypothetical protein DFQ00_105174 [Paenibacillus barcinonensis]QKS56624.1 hypothetical protein HUB98_09925 [Paenibacillus barcinonensis]